MDFTQSFNASDWAKAFVELVRQNPAIVTDEDAMIAWFANAIMRGYDEHARQSVVFTKPARITRSFTCGHSLSITRREP